MINVYFNVLLERSNTVLFCYFLINFSIDTNYSINFQEREMRLILNNFVKIFIILQFLPPKF